MIKTWRRLWSREQTGVSTVAFWMAAASVASRLLGVLRDRLLATQYGAGWELDAYYAAFRLPDTIYNLIIIGALSAGFIPLFAELRARKGSAAAWEFSSSVLGWASVLLAGLSFIGIVGAGRIVPLVVHGFDAQRLELTVVLARILFLSPLFLGISAVFGSVLQASKRVLAFAFAPVWYNLGILLGIVGFSRWLGIGGVALGVVFGALLHAATQGIVATGLGLAWPKRLAWTPDLRRLLVLTGPRLAALGTSQFSLVVLLSLASTLPSGSVAIFQLGNNLQSFPLGVVGISFALAAFPLLSEAAGAGRFDVYHDELAKTARKIIFFLLPAALLFLLLRAQIVRLVLGDGRFDWRATVETAEVVGWFAASLVAQALIPLFTRAFYAVQATWAPFWVTVFVEALNLLLAWTLRGRLGVAGLAAAFSCAAFVQLLLLWTLLYRRVGAQSFRGILEMAALAVGFSIPALAAAWGMRQLVGTLFPLRAFWQVALQFGASVAGGLSVYLLLMRAFGVREAVAFLGRGFAAVRRLLP